MRMDQILGQQRGQVILSTHRSTLANDEFLCKSAIVHAYKESEQ